MSYSTSQIRNVALAGHPGAGKTILFEALLHAGGTLQTAGTIERGNTLSDFDPIEKERGHSIDAAIASIDHGGIHVNLIDTPATPTSVAPRWARWRRWKPWPSWWTAKPASATAPAG